MKRKISVIMAILVLVAIMAPVVQATDTNQEDIWKVVINSTEYLMAKVSQGDTLCALLGKSATALQGNVARKTTNGWEIIEDINKIFVDWVICYPLPPTAEWPEAETPEIFMFEELNEASSNQDVTNNLAYCARVKYADTLSTLFQSVATLSELKGHVYLIDYPYSTNKKPLYNIDMLYYGNIILYIPEGSTGEEIVWLTDMFFSPVDWEQEFLNAYFTNYFRRGTLHKGVVYYGIIGEGQTVLDVLPCTMEELNTGVFQVYYPNEMFFCSWGDAHPDLVYPNQLVRLLCPNTPWPEEELDTVFINEEINQLFLGDENYAYKNGWSKRYETGIWNGGCTFDEVASRDPISSLYPLYWDKEKNIFYKVELQQGLWGDIF